MKNIFVCVLVASIFLVGCKDSDTQDQNPNQKSTIKIDTTYSGKIGESGSSVTIKYKQDTTTVEYHEKYWNEDKSIEYRHQYWDALKNVRFNRTDVYLGDEFRKGYQWDDKWGQTIISIDSIFNKKNKFRKLEITIGKEKKEDSNWYNYSLEKEFVNDKLLKFRIIDYNGAHEYLEQNNKYYEMETDVQIKYAEWEDSYKSKFGRIYSDAIKCYELAKVRVEKKYLDIAKEKYGFDLLKYNLQEGKNFH